MVLHGMTRCYISWTYDVDTLRIAESACGAYINYRKTEIGENTAQQPSATLDLHQEQ